MSQATELIAKQMAAGANIAKIWGDILYNVKSYGAKGDGTTDDTASTQATIDYALSVGGKAIFFPHGTYKVTALTNANQVVLFGDNASFVGGYTGTIHQLGDAATSLGLLNDVDPTPPTNTQVLQYEAASSKWKPNDKGLFNATSLDYGGAISQVHAKNTDGQVTMTLQHSEDVTNTNPLDTLRIYRVVSSLGGGARQQGGSIVRSTINAPTNHNEFGYFSVLDNYAEFATEQVGMYSQITNRGNAQSSIWGAVFEARNWNGVDPANTVDTVITGLEVDVVNNRAFSDTLKKIGVEVIAFGGGESTEAVSVYAGSNTRGNGSYLSGHWRYGFRILANALDATLGVGLQIKSSHGTGIEITGASNNYAINLQADAATTTGINIGANYTNPIAVQADKKIKLNGEANTQGIVYDSAKTAIVLTASKLGFVGNTITNSATAGGASALPATPSGYLMGDVSGTTIKIPYYSN